MGLLRELTDWRVAPPASMPPGLWVKLRQFIEWQMLQYPWTRQKIKLMRWAYVCEGINRGAGMPRSSTPPPV